MCNGRKGGAFVEQAMTISVDAQRRTLAAKGGFMLVTVLVITTVGLLFGAGALLLFRFQCQQRIDRQHELEKVYAVRSVLNCIEYKNNADKITEEGRSFEYFTASERKLGLFVKPVKNIFPDFDNPNHLDMGNEGQHGRILASPVAGQYNGVLDYEYGAESADGTEGENDLLKGIISVAENSLRGFGVDNVTSTNTRWWVNIGMSGTGGWLQSDYGRRYFFQPRQFVGGGYSEHTKDTIRLCLIRDKGRSQGGKHGWPLSEGERAIVFQIRQGVGANADITGEMSLSEYVCIGGQSMMVTNNIFWSNKIPAVLCYMGVQLAGSKVSLFYINKAGESSASSQLSRGYVFSDIAQLTPGTYSYFADGSIFDADGRITQAPDLRAVFEIVSTSDVRPEADKSEKDFLTWFRVTPAYQYDVFLEHPVAKTNLATVAQRILIGTSARGSNKYSVRTYDTHGTENRGFRKDEKHARERRGGE